MIKNKNIQLGFLVFLLTLLGLFLFVEQTKPKDPELSKIENTKTQDLAIKP